LRVLRGNRNDKENCQLLPTNIGVGDKYGLKFEHENDLSKKIIKQEKETTLKTTT